MIIQNLTKGLKKQDWFLVGFEIIIVVVGIIIGLQIDNWNEERKNRITEIEYLERLYEDMVGTIEDFKDNDNWDQTRLRTNKVVLNSLRSGVLPTDKIEDFAAGVLLIGVHNPIRRRWGTIEELKSTGNISLIQNIDLRNLIALTEASYNRVDRINSVQEQQITQFRTIIMQNVFPVITSAKTGGYNEADYDFESLVKNKAFVNAFAGANLSSEIIVSFMYNNLKEIEVLRDKIKMILDNKK